MNKKQKNVLYRIVVATILVVALTCIENVIECTPWIIGALYGIPYLVIGHDILKKAWKGILNRQVFDENFLMAVATLGAMLLNDYREGVAVMLFYQIGELFQSVAVGKSRRNIAALMDIRPDYANVLEDGKLVQVDPDEVALGTTIVVNPGEKVPIDGIVIQGVSTINTSALTGESVPRDVEVGQEIISGCVNLSGRMLIETTKEFGESTVSKILDLVENSSMKKSRSENFITRFAHYYTPVVCYSALVLAVLPPVVLMMMGQPALWSQWVTRALTFLVISCPCALVISIPLSFFGGIGCASSNGILVKGSNYLEILSETTIMVFDKTGTLTKGVFELTAMYPANGHSEKDLLEYAVYAEYASGHPISKSLQKAYGKDIDIKRVGNIEEIAGQGVKTMVDEVMVCAGNRKLMLREGISVNELHDEGTAVYVSVQGEYYGCIVISDVIKPTSQKAIAHLRQQGIKTVMLTGDAGVVAHHVSQAIGMDEVYSELLPQDKVREVERLLEKKESKEKLAFVGDGINDAPVLSRADIGIAMGALGSDAAIEAADIVLMDDDPAKISLAMRISRKTLRIVHQNIWFALVVKAVCLLLGAIGKTNMWLAIFADVGVMVIAVLNAVRVLRIKV